MLLSLSVMGCLCLPVLQSCLMVDVHLKNSVFSMFPSQQRTWVSTRYAALGQHSLAYFFYLFIFFSPSYIGWFKLNDYLYAQNCASLRYGSKVSMMAGRQLRRKATGILSEIQKWTQNHKTGHVYEVLYAICFVEEYNYKPSINPW